MRARERMPCQQAAHKSFQELIRTRTRTKSAFYHVFRLTEASSQLLKKGSAHKNGSQQDGTAPEFHAQELVKDGCWRSKKLLSPSTQLIVIPKHIR